MKIEFVNADELYELRRVCFRPTMDVTSVMYADDNDESTFHLAIKEDGKIASCITFTREKNPDFNIEKQFRMKGLWTDSD